MSRADLQFLEAQERNGGIVIKGRAFVIRTLHDLVLTVVRVRYEKGLNDKARGRITQAAQTHGLLDAEAKPTSKYFALIDDEAEKLTRELTGQNKQAAGLCACGCGRMTRGRAKTATQACRKRMSRMAA